MHASVFFCLTLSEILHEHTNNLRKDDVRGRYTALGI